MKQLSIFLCVLFGLLVVPASQAKTAAQEYKIMVPTSRPHVDYALLQAFRLAKSNQYFFAARDAVVNEYNEIADYIAKNTARSSLRKTTTFYRNIERRKRDFYRIAKPALEKALAYGAQQAKRVYHLENELKQMRQEGADAETIAELTKKLAHAKAGLAEAEMGVKVIEYFLYFEEEARIRHYLFSAAVHRSRRRR